MIKRGRRTLVQSTTHEVFISKTKEMGDALDSENNMSGYYDTEVENRQRLNRKKQDIKSKETNRVDISSNDLTAMGKVAPSLRGFMRLDAKFFFPVLYQMPHRKGSVRSSKVHEQFD